MREFKTIFGYEMKKILMRKLTWAAFVMIVLVCVGPAAGSMFAPGMMVDGNEVVSNMELNRMDMANKKMLAGRWIDRELLEETMQGYARIPEDLSSYDAMMDYLKYARPYFVIFNFIRSNSLTELDEISDWPVDEMDLYASRVAMLEELYRLNLLSEQEKEFWRAKESKLQWPVKFEVTDCYAGLYYTLSTLCFVLPLCISICLSNVFAGEHTKRTDQLILCGRKGLHTVYWAKISAGIVFTMLYFLFALVFAFLPCLLIYGTDGFHAAFQLIYARYSLPLTVGEATIIMYGVLLVAAVLFAVVVMVLSEATRSAITALSAVAVYILAALIFPNLGKRRVFSQIWNWLPGCFVVPQNIFDLRMVSVFGKLFFSWQAVPVMYLMAVAGVAAAGASVYRRYQVSGR